MKILSIETSCDETAISIIEAAGGASSPSFSVLGNTLYSQIAIHAQYGGVFPMVAKREHAKNLPPILEKTLREADMFSEGTDGSEAILWSEIKTILQKEDGLFESFEKLLRNVARPAIDAICVTNGPGLEPALWVGITFAQALGKLWNLPVIPVNHMEGHIYSILTRSDEENKFAFPALALLISGGHTELVFMEKMGSYKVIGKTVDDAVGEAYDKTARMLGLPYPGGPEISRLAKQARDENIPHKAKLPRPMLHSPNLNFSFSGLKTAVLYHLRDNYGMIGEKPVVLSTEDKADIAREIEDSIADVLLSKTIRAIEEYGISTLIIAGGVIANDRLRSLFQDLEATHHGLSVKTPEKSLATDNALMIAIAGYIKLSLHPETVSYPQQIRAKGNIELE